MQGWGKDRGRWVVAERAAGADTEAFKDWSLQETKWFGLAAAGVACVKEWQVMNSNRSGQVAPQR